VWSEVRGLWPLLLGERRELCCAYSASKLEAPGLATGHSPAVSRGSRVRFALMLPLGML